MKNYPSLTEDHLLRLLKEDDGDAFTEIYNRYWQRLFGLSFHRLGDRQAAEDVVHEVFTSIWQRRNVLQVHSLNAYLSTAAKYCILKQVARQSNLASDLTSVIEIGVEDSSPDARMLERMIYDEVNRLPEKCRLVFEYSRGEYLSNKEIAVKLGISQKAVEKHITRALRHLRLQLRYFTSFFVVWAGGGGLWAGSCGL